MVTMTWGRRPPVVGRVPAARAALQAPTRPSRRCWGRVRRSRSGSGVAVLKTASRLTAAPPVLLLSALPLAAALSLPCRSAVGGVGVVVRGLVAVFMTVRRCSYWSVVAKISRWWSPRRGRRRKAPWRWRSSSSEGSVPSWSMASAQRWAMRVRKSWSFSTAVLGQACSISASRSGSAMWRTRSRAVVMMVPAREAMVPSARAAAVSSQAGGMGWPVIPVRGRMAEARARRRRASAAPILSRVRRNSAVFRHPSSAGDQATAEQGQPVRAVEVAASEGPGVTEPRRVRAPSGSVPQPVVQPAARLGPGGVDRGGPGPVDRGGGEQLQLLDPARNLLGQLSEIRSLQELGPASSSGAAVIAVSSSARPAFRVSKSPALALPGQLIEGRAFSKRRSDRTGAGGSTAVGRVLYQIASKGTGAMERCEARGRAAEQRHSSRRRQSRLRYPLDAPQWLP